VKIVAAFQYVLVESSLTNIFVERCIPDLS